MCHLSPEKLKILVDSLMGCPQIKDEQILKTLLYFLIIQYPSLGIQFHSNSNLNQVLIDLVIQSSHEPGSLKYFIDTLETLYAVNSTPVKNLRDVYERIYGILPPEARIKSTHDQINITTDNNETIPLSISFSRKELSEIEGLNLTQEWRNIHNFSEQIGRLYISIYKCIFAKKHTDTRDNINHFHAQFNRLNSHISQMNQIVFNNHPVNHIRHIPECVNCLIHAVENSYNPFYYQQAENLAEWMENLLFELRQLADRILQEHFDHQESQETEEN